MKIFFLPESVSLSLSKSCHCYCNCHCHSHISKLERYTKKRPHNFDNNHVSSPLVLHILIMYTCRSSAVVHGLHDASIHNPTPVLLVLIVPPVTLRTIHRNVRATVLISAQNLRSVSVQMDHFTGYGSV